MLFITCWEVCSYINSKSHCNALENAIFQKNRQFKRADYNHCWEVDISFSTKIIRGICITAKLQPWQYSAALPVLACNKHKMNNNKYMCSRLWTTAGGLDQVWEELTHWHNINYCEVTHDGIPKYNFMYHIIQHKIISCKIFIYIANLMVTLLLCKIALYASLLPW